MKYRAIAATTGAVLVVAAAVLAQARSRNDGPAGRRRPAPGRRSRRASRRPT